jgi:hypothetical protein
MIVKFDCPRCGRHFEWESWMEIHSPNSQELCTECFDEVWDEHRRRGNYE